MKEILVLVRVTIAVIKNNLGRKGFILFTVHAAVHNPSSDGRNLEAGADADAMEEGCLLACSS